MGDRDSALAALHSAILAQAEGPDPRGGEVEVNRQVLSILTEDEREAA